MRNNRRRAGKETLRLAAREAPRASANPPRGAGRPATAGKRRQRDVLCDVMLSASQCQTWLTLEELAKLTHYPPASISAQLRHLRRPEFGGFEVRKRQRKPGQVLRGEDFGIVWEYQLRRNVRRMVTG
jgi:hypothetical protein